MRLNGWETRLLDAIALHDKMPMEYGVSDCLIQVADCIQALTGEDPMAELRGTYHSEVEAQEVLASLGYNTVEDALADRLEEVAPLQARRGDVGVVRYAGSIAAVVVMGSIVVGKSHAGSIRASVSRLDRAFKVG